MENQSTISAFMRKGQPLTPDSPFHSSSPLVFEAIPQLPMTPPDTEEVQDIAANEDGIRTALHVISTERDSLTHLGELYKTSPMAQEGFINAISNILKTISRGGKLVVSGVGKSGKIGEKVVATMNSFGIRCTFLHPTEALHGDLGMIGVNDTILLLTFSGRTPELLTLLAHLPHSLPLIALTSHTHPSTCPLFIARPPSRCILLPAPIPTSETQSFGLPAPTTSTTTAMALADALALAAASRLHPSPASIFHSHHPGGAIGASATTPVFKSIGNLAIAVTSVPIAEGRLGVPILTALDILLTAAKSSSGWVRLSSSTIITPRQVQRIGKSGNLDRAAHALESGTVVEKGDWISIPGSSLVAEARGWILGMRKGERGKTFLKQGTVLGIVDDGGSVSGVVEIEEIFGEEEEERWESVGF